MGNLKILNIVEYILAAFVEDINQSISVAKGLKKYLQSSHMRRIVSKPPYIIPEFLSVFYRT